MIWSHWELNIILIVWVIFIGNRPPVIKKSVDSSETSVCKAQACSDLVEYIESFRGSHMSLPFSDMVALYESRLISLGIDTQGHSTRLPQDIEDYILDLIVIRNLSSTYSLAFDELIRHALEIISTNQDKISGVRLLPKAAKLLRQNIFATVNEVDDSFTQDSEEWQMLCMMSKMQRRLVKHRCE